MLLHRRKIAVIVQQRMATFDAEGADDDVGGLADCDAQFSQLAIVAGGTRGQVGVQERDESITAQSAFNARRVGLVPSALKDFEQDEITDQEWFPRGCGFEFRGRQRSMAAQVRNPDGGVDENQRRP